MTSTVVSHCLLNLSFAEAWNSVPQSFMYLNAWVPSWYNCLARLGGVALLEKIYWWGKSLDFKSQWHFNWALTPSFMAVTSTWKVSGNAPVPCLPAMLPDIIVFVNSPLKLEGPIKGFLLLIWVVLVMVSLHSSRKVTKTSSNLSSHSFSWSNFYDTSSENFPGQPN